MQQWQRNKILFGGWGGGLYVNTSSIEFKGHTYLLSRKPDEWSVGSTKTAL